MHKETTELSFPRASDISLPGDCPRPWLKRVLLKICYRSGRSVPYVHTADNFSNHKKGRRCVPTRSPGAGGWKPPSSTKPRLRGGHQFRKGAMPGRRGGLVPDNAPFDDRGHGRPWQGDGDGCGGCGSSESLSSRLPGDPGQKSVIPCLRNWNLPPATCSVAWRPPSPWGAVQLDEVPTRSHKAPSEPPPCQNARVCVCGDGQSLGFCVPLSISCYQLNMRFNKIVYVSPKVATQKKKREEPRPVNI